MKRHFAPAVFTRGVTMMLAAAMFAAPALAHKAHQDNMTDAEMAQMEAQATSEMHDEMPNMMPPGMGSSIGPDGAEPARTANRPVAKAAGPLIMQAEVQPGSNQKVDLQGTVTPELSAQDALAVKAAENRLTSAGDLLGRLHPAAVHFPIGLLIFAALAELAFFFRPALGLETTVRFLVAGGALSAVLAAVLGWFAGGWRLVDRSETLGLHRWNGTFIAAVSLIAWLLLARGKSRAGVRAALALLAAALVVQGYLGGEMADGPNHLGVF
jgi:uncharacterized membrane protein